MKIDHDDSSLNKKMCGHILVDSLRTHGVKMVFGVPGESYLAVLDGLQDANSIQTIICRQEGGATMMAEAYGKMTGQPGICLVTRGPGATNASAGVHIAMQDSTPLILLVGQVGRGMMDREAFQEIDYRRMYGEMAKWVAQIDDPMRIPEYISRAFYTATSGRPGPVVLALPEDMLTEYADNQDVNSYTKIEPYPAPDDIQKLRGLMENASSPLMIIGGGGWDAITSKSIEEFSSRNNLPVGCSFRCQDYFDNRHKNYVGHIGIGLSTSLQKRVLKSDLLLVVGARLGEVTTGGYSLLNIPKPRQILVHVHAGAEELGSVYQPDLPINAGPRQFARAIEDLTIIKSKQWLGSTQEGHSDYLKTLVPQPIPGDVQMGKIASWLNQKLPDDAFICNGAGNYATWMHRFFQYRQYRTQLAPTSGSMGYGLPSAVAAKLVHPDRLVLSMNGDGCFMMHGQELATAMQYGANIIIIIINNGMFGTIRMHQEREYPGRVANTGLQNPDFAALARAYGAFGELVTKTEQFYPAFERAMKAKLPTIIEIMIDPNAITPVTTLTAIREEAMVRNSRAPEQTNKTETR
ncbi:MAG: thiamine pyrophosphate-binding protein [Rhodospirillaceae bacterium]|nr:thiamine pyrophosphate-binding protein [Rhodospirillaceae bacterium]